MKKVIKRHFLVDMYEKVFVMTVHPLIHILKLAFFSKYHVTHIIHVFALKGYQIHKYDKMFRLSSLKALSQITLYFILFLFYFPEPGVNGTVRNLY